MPSKNVVKIYQPDSYYHVYNRGVAKQTIFHDADDKKKFLQIIARHLDPSNMEVRYDGVLYEKHNAQLELLCYCLMGNHDVRVRPYNSLKGGGGGQLVE